MKHKSFARVLAIDLHPRHFGYVILESPDRLLDWGVQRSYRKTKRHPEVLAGRLCSLLNIWTPDVVMTLVGRRRNADIQLLCRRLRKDVGVKSLLVIKSSPDFIGHRKYERAAAIAARFPEVGWKLPAKRKTWESEHYSMSMFEALAIAVAYAAG